jgi:signal transduction histidine kinase
MRSVLAQLVHDLRNALSSADLHLQALGRSEAAPRQKHLNAARQALADGANLVDQLDAALPDDESALDGRPQDPH